MGWILWVTCAAFNGVSMGQLDIPLHDQSIPPGCSLSHSHTIATTSRRPMTTDDQRQPSTTNYRPNFRSTIGRRPVADQSPTNCQSLADRTPTEFRIIIKIWKPIGDWLSQNQRLVGNHSAIGRRPIGVSIDGCDLHYTSCALGEQRLGKFMHTNLKLLLWAWQSKEWFRILLMRKVTAYYSFVILIILLTARLTKEVLMLCINLSHPLFS